MTYEIRYGKADVKVYRTHGSPLRGVTSIPESPFTGRENTLMAAELERDPALEVINDVVINQALVGVVGDESGELTADAVERIQQDGTCWLAATRWRGRPAIRISVCNWRTGEEDIRRSAHSKSGVLGHPLVQLDRRHLAQLSDQGVVHRALSSRRTSGPALSTSPAPIVKKTSPWRRTSATVLAIGPT